MEIHELHPRNITFKVGNREFSLSPITWKKKIETDRLLESSHGKNDGNEVLNNAFTSIDYLTISKFVFHMLVPEDKKKFKDHMDFVDIFKHEADFIECTHLALERCFGVSNPDEEEFPEIKKPSPVAGRRLNGGISMICLLGVMAGLSIIFFA